MISLVKQTPFMPYGLPRPSLRSIPRIVYASRLVLVRLVLAPLLRLARHRFRFRLPMLRFKSESRFALGSRNILLTRAMISSSVCSISG
jgi:hypothetical protein